jgi:hypothetical protein
MTAAPRVDDNSVRVSPPPSERTRSRLSLPPASYSVFFVSSSAYAIDLSSFVSVYEASVVSGTSSRYCPDFTSIAPTLRRLPMRRRSSHDRNGSLLLWTNTGPVVICANVSRAFLRHSAV